MFVSEAIRSHSPAATRCIRFLIRQSPPARPACVCPSPPSHTPSAPRNLNAPRRRLFLSVTSASQRPRSWVRGASAVEEALHDTHSPHTRAYHCTHGATLKASTKSSSDSMPSRKNTWWTALKSLKSATVLGGRSSSTKFSATLDPIPVSGVEVDEINK